MFNFHFVYADGLTYDVNHVNKIIINKSGKAKILEGDKILTEALPLSTMCLYTDEKNITISGENLIIVDALKNT